MVIELNSIREQGATNIGNWWVSTLIDDTPQVDYETDTMCPVGLADLVRRQSARRILQAIFLNALADPGVAASIEGSIEPLCANNPRVAAHCKDEAA